MSLNSSARTWVIDCDRADTISGNRSVIPPGWIPVPWTEVPPAVHAASIADSSRPAGKNQLSGVTTLAPDARIRATTDGSAMIGEYTTQSAPERQQRLDVVRGRHPDRVDAAQLADVDADLVGAVHPAPDQFELGVGDDARHRRPSDPAGRPLDHLDGHRRPPPCARCRLHRRHERTAGGASRADTCVPSSVAE